MAEPRLADSGGIPAGVLEETHRLIAAGAAASALRLIRQHLTRDVAPIEAAPGHVAAARALIALGRDEEAIEELVSIEGALPDVEAARLEALVSELRVVTGQPGGSITDATRVLESGRRIRDAGTIGRAWKSLNLALYYRGEIADSVHAAEEGLAWARAAGADGPTEADGLLTLAVSAMHADDFDRSAVLLGQAMEASPSRLLAAETRITRASLDFHAGRWDAALATFDESMSTESLPDWLVGFSAGIVSIMQVHQDRVEEAVRSLDRAPTIVAPAPRPMHLWATMLTSLARGMTDDAAALADRLSRVTTTLRSPVRMRLYGPDLVQVFLAVGDRAAAIDVTVTLETVAARAGVPSVTAAARLCRGLVERDVVVLETAAALFESSPRRFEAATARMVHAEHLVDMGHPTQAIASFERALIGFAAIGAYRNVGVVERSMRALGRKPGRRGRRPRDANGWASLTPTEHRVASLVALGLSNAQIAERMVVSTRTVEAHLAHVFAKLQVHSRTQVAIVANGRERCQRP